MPDRFEFGPSRCDRSPGRELLAELIDHFNGVYPGRAARPGSVTTPDEMVAPHGVFLVGYANGEPIAIGGLRPLEEDGVCEIKRMYVMPAARSRGRRGAAGRARAGGARNRLSVRPARRGPSSATAARSSPTSATSRSSATTTTTSPTTSPRSLCSGRPRRSADAGELDHQPRRGRVGHRAGSDFSPWSPRTTTTERERSGSGRGSRSDRSRPGRRAPRRRSRRAPPGG